MRAAAGPHRHLALQPARAPHQVRRVQRPHAAGDPHSGGTARAGSRGRRSGAALPPLPRTAGAAAGACRCPPPCPLHTGAAPRPLLLPRAERCWRGQRRPGPAAELSASSALPARGPPPGEAVRRSAVPAERGQVRGSPAGAPGCRAGTRELREAVPGRLAAPWGLCRAPVSLWSGMRCEARSKGDSRLPGRRCVPTPLPWRAGKTPLCLRSLVFAPDGSCPLLQACLSISGSVSLI